MISRHKFTQLTLVLVFLLAPIGSTAAPNYSNEDIKDTSDQNNQPAPEGLKDMDVSVTPNANPLKFKKTTSEVYFPYQSSISPRFGSGTDTDHIKNNHYYYFFGLQYQLPSDDGRHWEAGADVLDDGTGVLSIGRKFRLNATEALRPYFKVAGAIHTVPSEQLTTFLRIDNFQIRPSLGYEYFLQHPSSFRMELESWVGTKLMGIHLTVGYSYAW